MLMFNPQQLHRGAGDEGLICGFSFDATGQASPINDLATLDLGEARPGFLWLHFNLNHSAALRWLAAHGGLDDQDFAATQQGSRSTRIERDGDRLFAVINDVVFDFDFEADDVASLWLWASPRLVISARRRPLRSIDRLRMDARRGERFTSSTMLLDRLLREQGDELQRIARQVTDRLVDIEDELLADHHTARGGDLSKLRRLMVRLQRVLAPDPAALGRLLAMPPPWMAQEDLAHLRGTHEEFALVLADIAVLQERIKLLQDESALRVAEANNRSLFTLTMVTVLALPINLGAGLMGMNVGGIPFADHGQGFWIVVTLIGLVTMLLARVLRRLLKPTRRDRR